MISEMINVMTGFRPSGSRYFTFGGPLIHRN